MATEGLLRHRALASACMHGYLVSWSLTQPAFSLANASMATRARLQKRGWPRRRGGASQPRSAVLWLLLHGVPLAGLPWLLQPIDCLGCCNPMTGWSLTVMPFNNNNCRLVVAGETHLAAYQEGADEEMRAFALAYCQQRDAMFGSVGTVRRGVLPTKLAAHGGAISTYSPGSRAVCRGADCAFVAVFECVPEGARACSVDEAGNIG